MLLPLLLQTTWPTLHPLALLAISTVVGLAVAYGWKRYDAAATNQKARQESENIWRQARLDVEKALGERITTETQARVMAQLENEGDLSSMTQILKEFSEVQRLLAVVASDSKHHAADIDRLNRRLDENSQKLDAFILRHVKSA